jgi:hypothetical protein
VCHSFWCLLVVERDSIISGQCGFPGRKLNGRVYRVEDSDELGALWPIDVVEKINADNWTQQELYPVAYRCDNDPLMGDDSERDHSGMYQWKLDRINSTWW